MFNYYLTLSLIFILGLIMGSFYNVIIVRTLNNESIIFPSSKCPKCQKKLKWWQNIPILSYFILRGKCNYCSSQIDVLYPIIEVISGLIYTLAFIKYGYSYDCLFITFIISLFVILAGMDYKSKLISSKLAILLIISCILFNYSNIISSIMGAITAGVVVFLSRRLFNNLFKTEVIGEGDIYLFSALGGLSGITLLPLAFAITIIIQFLIILPTYFKKIIQTKNHSYITILFWFSTSIILGYYFKNHVLELEVWLKNLIFFNVILSSLLLSKKIISECKSSLTTDIAALSPSILLSVFIIIFII